MPTGLGLLSFSVRVSHTLQRPSSPPLWRIWEAPSANATELTSSSCPSICYNIWDLLNNMTRERPKKSNFYNYEFLPLGISVGILCHTSKCIRHYHHQGSCCRHLRMRGKRCKIDDRLDTGARLLDCRCPRTDQQCELQDNYLVSKAEVCCVILTALWPTWVNDIVSVWTESSVQNTPTDVTSLDGFEKFELTLASVVEP